MTDPRFQVHRDKGPAKPNQPWPWWGTLIAIGMLCATVVACGYGYIHR